MSDATSLLIYMIENLALVILRGRAESYASENGLTAREMYQWAMIQRAWVVCEVSQEVYRKAMDRLASWEVKAPSFIQYHEVMISVASIMSCALDSQVYGCASFNMTIKNAEDKARRDGYKMMLANIRANTIVHAPVEMEEIPVVCYDGFDRVALIEKDSIPYDGFHRYDSAIFHQPSSKYPKHVHVINKRIGSEYRSRIFYVEGVACVNY